MHACDANACICDDQARVGWVRSSLPYACMRRECMHTWPCICIRGRTNYGLLVMEPARWKPGVTHGAPPHRAPSPRCTADLLHRVWLQVVTRITIYGRWKRENWSDALVHRHVERFLYRPISSWGQWYSELYIGAIRHMHACHGSGTSGARCMHAWAPS